MLVSGAASKTVEVRQEVEASTEYVKPRQDDPVVIDPREPLEVVTNVDKDLTVSWLILELSLNNPRWV